MAVLRAPAPGSLRPFVRCVAVVVTVAVSSLVCVRPQPVLYLPAWGARKVIYSASMAAAIWLRTIRSVGLSFGVISNVRATCAASANAARIA